MCVFIPCACATITTEKCLAQIRDAAGTCTARVVRFNKKKKAFQRDMVVWKIQGRSGGRALAKKKRRLQVLYCVNAK